MSKGIQVSTMVCVYVLLLAASASAQFRTVTVQNAPNNPIPVQQQGTVDVSGSSVSVTNTPNVSVSNTPNVNVANTPAVTISGTSSVTVGNLVASPVPTRDNDDPARQPFTATTSFNVTNGTSNNSVSIIQVPANKELVIEFLSVNTTNVATGGQIFYNYGISSISGGTFSFYQMAPSKVSLTTGDYFYLNQPVRIYADPGTTVVFGVNRDTTTNLVGLHVTISGHLVNLP